MPEADQYGLAIAVVYCLSIYSLSTLVREWWLWRWWRVEFWPVHLVTMSVVILGSSFVVNIFALFETTLLKTILSVPAGLALAWAAIGIDRAVVRGISRRNSAKRGRDKRGQRRSIGSARDYMPTHVNADQKPWSALWILALIAVLEEIIFRGFLVRLCLLVPQPGWAAVALSGTVAVFGLAHVQFGWSHVLGKLPLGMLATASVLLLQTLLPAILIHVLFNWKIWRDTDGDLRTIFRSTW